MNTTAMTLPTEALAGAVQERIARRTAEIAARDARQPHRVRITSYMENIGWPELFGYTMDRFFTDPDFAVEQRLRQLIFWADNVADDTLPSTVLPADVGMYFDLTLFGQEIIHTPQGVPEFSPHPLAQALEFAALGTWDFQTTGAMPQLIANYRRMQEIAPDGFQVSFPCFHRGPLDILVQLRGYENFVDDLAEQPEKVEAFLLHFADARLRYARERQAFLGEASLPPTTMIADDWVNVPFLSPSTIRDFVLPVYRRIRAQEGPLYRYHTCGNFEAVVADLLALFPDLPRLEVSGWNDVRAIHRALPAGLPIELHVRNAVSLSASADEQRALLDAVAEVARERPISLCAQAIVRLQPTYEETLGRLNGFIELGYAALNAKVLR
jgi:hypothetical protein